MIDSVGLLGDPDLEIESSVVLTYDLDLMLYDGWTRRVLGRAGASNQVVFCDHMVYSRELSAAPTTKGLGRLYSVVPVVPSGGGAFHPKAYLLLGPARGRLLIGSGNATQGGLFRNVELFGAFDFSIEAGKPPHPAFGIVAELARSLATNAPERVRRQVDLAFRRASWLRTPPGADAERMVLVSGPGRPPLLTQLTTLLQGRKVRGTVVVSASFDRDLRGLRALSDATGRAPIRCLVEPKEVELDGAAVRGLGKIATWSSFVDPTPRKKGRPPGRTHAKLIIVDCGDRELVVYGSPNASGPALSDPESNVELAVATWVEGSNTTLERLGLKTSIEGTRIDDDLARRAWPVGDSPSAPGLPVALSGAALDGRRLVLSLARPLAKGGLQGADVEMSDGAIAVIGRLPAVSTADHLEAALRQDQKVAPRLVRVVRAADGLPLSNWVALTHEDVVSIRGRLDARLAPAIACMHDGEVLGTVLFDLLSRCADLTERSLGFGSGASEGESKPDEPEHAEGRDRFSYYTDATPSVLRATITIQDRIELDLLTALMRPIATPANQEERDESLALGGSEEEQALAVDREQVPTSPLGAPEAIPREALERAVRRAEVRLDRTAAAAERRMQKAGPAVSAGDLARLLVTNMVGAFLAGRTLESEEGEDVEGINSYLFARHVLRLCSALAGSLEKERPGLLKRVPVEAWEGPDGQVLREGLSFLWTCCLWATDEMTHNNWDLDFDEDATPAVVAARLVCGRFIASIRTWCEKPDARDLRRRLPATVDRALDEATSLSALELAAFIERIERDRPAAPQIGSEAPAGTLVYSPSLGVSVSLGGAGRNVRVLDLSRPDDSTRQYARLKVVALSLAGWPLVRRWRDGCPLVPEDE